MPMRQGLIVEVTASSLALEYWRRVRTWPEASRPTKKTEFLARSRPMVATTFRTLVGNDRFLFFILMTFSPELYATSTLSVTFKGIGELVNAARWERAIP